MFFFCALSLVTYLQDGRRGWRLAGRHAGGGPAGGEPRFQRVVGICESPRRGARRWNLNAAAAAMLDRRVSLASVSAVDVDSQKNVKR